MPLAISFQKHLFAHAQYFAYFRLMKHTLSQRFIFKLLDRI